MKGIVVLPSLITSLFDDREKEICLVFRVFGYDFSHALLPFDAQFLSCLPSAIGQDAILKVSLFEVRHIYERHASGIEAEHEHISGKVQ